MLWFIWIVNKGKWSIQGNGATKSKYSKIVYAIVMPTPRRKLMEEPLLDYVTLGM